MSRPPQIYVAVVDDDESLCRSLGRLLRIAGIQPITYLSAEAFLEDAKHPKFDCLVFDLQLGGMSGMDLFQKLSKTKSKVPVIRPKRLKSVAFTNNPNLPVQPLANDANGLTVEAADDSADLLITTFIELGILQNSDRDEWKGYFAEDFKTAAWCLANYGTSDGARKGRETRRGNMAKKDPANVAAKVAAKTMRGSRPIPPRGSAITKHPAYKKAINEGASHEVAIAEARGDIDHEKQMSQMQTNADKAKAALPLKLTPKPINPAVKVAAATARSTPPPLPKLGTPERAALLARK
ncbi:MAG: response regulator [Methylacidiphilales bacterium]|nr:response regulator [Candidatus Methylacidiphilales bacterium]